MPANVKIYEKKPPNVSVLHEQNMKAQKSNEFSCPDYTYFNTLHRHSHTFGFGFCFVLYRVLSVVLVLFGAGRLKCRE